MKNLWILGLIHQKPRGDDAAPLSEDATSVVAGASAQIVRSGVVSMFDQAVVSGTSFFTTLIIARSCTQEELGIYSLAWTVVLFLAALQSNLVTVPYTVYCHRRNGRRLALYAGSTLIHQLLTSVAAIAVFLCLDLVLAAGYGPEGVRTTAWALLVVIPFLLLREYARRFTFAHLALALAVTIDVAVAVMQLSGLLVLRHYELLNAGTAYLAMGIACAVAWLCWWMLDRQPMQFSRAHIWADWWHNWAFSRWAIASQLTGLAFYLLPWLLATVHGEAAAGELAACSTLVGLSNLFILGLNNLLMPHASRAFRQHGVHDLADVLRQTAGMAFVVLGGLCVFVYFAGGFVAGLVFGSEYADTGSIITLLAVATLADAMGLIASTGLWAMDRPGLSIIGDLFQLVVTMVVAFALVWRFGVMGIVLAMVAGRTIGAVVRWLTIALLSGYWTRLAAYMKFNLAAEQKP